jgi:hypothetical protein
VPMTSGSSWLRSMGADRTDHPVRRADGHQDPAVSPACRSMCSCSCTGPRSPRPPHGRKPSTGSTRISFSTPMATPQRSPDTGRCLSGWIGRRVRVLPQPRG